MDASSGDSMASSNVEISALPDEILCHIFSKLNPEYVIKCVANVCQRWKNVAEEKIFWNNVQLVVDCDYFFNYGYIDESFVKLSPSFVRQSAGIYVGEKDLHRVHKVKNVKFTEGSKIIDELVSLLLRILDSFSKYCHDIEIVEFFSCFGAATRAVMKFLRENFKKIKEIRYGTNTSILYVFPYNEVSRFTNLKTLVTHDILFTSSSLWDLSNGCEHLSSLWVLLSKSLMEGDILYFLEKKKHILTELGLGSRLNDNILNKLKECRSLEVLFATDARYVTDVCLKSFAHQSSLKYCSLHDAKIQRTTVSEIAGLSRKPGVFKNLIMLDLTRYNNYQAEYFRSWGGCSEGSHNKEHITSITTKAFQNYVELTFNNPIERSIELFNYSSSSKEHWMYRHRNNETYY